VQYALLKKFWPKAGRGDYQVVLIEVSEEDAMKRLARRVSCENCGAVDIEGRIAKCRECRGRLVKRSDDYPAAIRTRLALFYSETIPMIQAMEADGKVLHVDGALPVNDVHRNILAKLQVNR
jgi:adenylate kinase